MSMSKKDFVAIARAINVSHVFLCDDRDPIARHITTATAKRIAEHIAEHCATQNPLFDRARFLKACGVVSD